MANARPPTIRQRTDFIRALSAPGATVKKAAEYANVPRRSVYYWRDEDPEFAEAWKYALKESKDDTLALYENELRERALDRKDPKSYVLLIFLLKKLDPTYKENYKNEVTIKHEKSREYDFSKQEVDEAREILEAAHRRSKPSEASDEV